MKNYLTIDGHKIPISEETANSIKAGLHKNLTYEDIAEKLFKDKKYYFIDTYGSIKQSTDYYILNLNNATSSVQLERLLIQNQLTNIAEVLNDGWVTDLDGIRNNYAIAGYLNENIIKINTYTYLIHPTPYFKTKELAEQAIGILGEDKIRLMLGMKKL